MSMNAGQVSAPLSPVLLETAGRVYRTIRWSTRRRDCLVIFIQGYPDPFNIPVDWLARGGCNTWRFVDYLMHRFVNEDGLLLNINDATGAAVNPDDAPMPGSYLFRSRDATVSFSWRIGPQGARRQGIKSQTASDASSSSRGSSASTLQSRFREEVLMRDYNCIVTDKTHIPTVAAHLVPKARTDVYEKLLGDDFQRNYPYLGGYGILLDLAIHGSFHNYELSLFPADDAEGSYYVHTFREESLGQYHGKHITRARFHPQTPTSDLPDKRLCEWHYTQCILQNLRGFGCSPPIAP